MPNVEGQEFRGVIAGGDAGNGSYVWLTIGLGDRRQTILIEKSRVGELMLGLATAASMARNTRITRDPTEADSTGSDTAYALNVVGAEIGRSTDGESAIVDVRIETGAGTMNLFLVARPKGLVALGNACRRALAMLAAKPKRRAN